MKKINLIMLGVIGMASFNGLMGMNDPSSLPEAIEANASSSLDPQEQSFLGKVWGMRPQQVYNWSVSHKKTVATILGLAAATYAAYRVATSPSKEAQIAQFYKELQELSREAIDDNSREATIKLARQIANLAERGISLGIER